MVQKKLPYTYPADKFGMHGIVWVENQGMELIRNFSLNMALIS
jgi:hypothetical protein